MKGGPEAIAARDQIAAINNGTIDIGQTTVSNASPVVKEALCLFATGKNSTQLRQNGFLDTFDSYFQAKGVKFVSYDGDGQTFNIFTKKAVTKLGDFKGIILRSNLNYDPFFKALGCSLVSVDTTEIYNALQSGIVDGYGYPGGAVVASGFIDQTKNYIQQPLWNGGPMLVMNLSSYNKLPQNLQKILADVSVQQETVNRKDWADQLVNAEIAFKKANINFVTFSAEETKTYVDLSKSSVWDSFISNNPTSGPILKAAADK
jgi:TRAP-type C4-dicarboxylate transport system substrate-binding protein